MTVARGAWLAVLLLAAIPAATAAAGTALSPEDMTAYAAARHFKALAVSDPAAGNAPLVRFSFNYDTPRTALQAAMAYCEEARGNTPEAQRGAPCRPAWLGPYAVDGLDADGLKAVEGRYLEETIAALTEKLAVTNDRAIRTSLETVLHKSGRFAQSEALLADLAASGEALARNALAYHWAERKINLDRALAYADSAVAAEPGNASFHDTRGLVLYRLGRLEEALAVSARAAGLNPHPIILDHYGDILWAAGRCAEAARAWQRAATGSADILFRQRVEHKIYSGSDGPPVFE